MHTHAQTTFTHTQMIHSCRCAHVCLQTHAYIGNAPDIWRQLILEPILSDSGPETDLDYPKFHVSTRVFATLYSFTD